MDERYRGKKSYEKRPRERLKGIDRKTETEGKERRSEKEKVIDRKILNIEKHIFKERERENERKHTMRQEIRD